MSYDPAGSLTTDTYSGAAVSRSYDAENHLTGETQANNYLAGSYTYDAVGQRVRRKVNSVETWQVYGLGGELLAEYAANASPASPQKEYGYRNGQLLITANCPAPAAKLTLSGATASSYYTTGYEPAKAIDGNPTTTTWNAGTFAPAWIQVDLGQTYSLSQVRLLTAQYPDGHTTHEIYGGPSPSSLTLLGTVDGSTSSSQWLQLTTGATNVRYVKVLTTASPSWIAWFEVEVYQAAQPADVGWLVTDQLGTPRMMFDQTGALATTKRHDYLPFGEELYAGTGGRTTTQGYIGDSVRQHFTGYEADGETGLNFAEARYQSSAQGRFTSVDPLGASANVGDPQSFNRYSYVLNNPTNLTDPSGLIPYGADRSWDDVEGGFWGSYFDPNGSHFGGPAIVAAAAAHRDELVQGRIDGMRAQQYLNKGDFAAAQRIFDNNANVGLFQNGKVLWGDLAGTFVGGYSAGMSQAAVASLNPLEAIRLGTKALMLAGWRAVVNKLSKIRSPDFKILNVNLVAGMGRFIARGDDMSSALHSLNGGEGAELSFSVGWILQRETPTHEDIVRWGSGLSFSSSAFSIIGGGFIKSATPNMPEGVIVGVGVGQGISGSFTYKPW